MRAATTLMNSLQWVFKKLKRKEVNVSLGITGYALP